MTTREYATYCGPAAVASVLEISRAEAARRLRACGPGCRAPGATWPVTIGKLLKARVYELQRPITVKEWLRRNRRNAILGTNDHVMHVRDGLIVEDNGQPSLGSLVKTVIYPGTSRATLSKPKLRR